MGKFSKDTQREKDLSQMIESIYKLFGEINSHLKKLLDPQNKSKIVSYLDAIVKE